MTWLIAAVLAATTVTTPASWDPVDRGLTLARGSGEVGVGLSQASGDFAYDLDGSRLRGDRLTPLRRYRDDAILLTGTYGLTERWEIGFTLPYLRRYFEIDRQPLVDTEGRLITEYPASRTSGLGDATFTWAVRTSQHTAIRGEWKTASGLDNFFPLASPSARPARYLGSGQSNVLLLFAGDLMWAHTRAEGAAGYRARLSGISNYLLRAYNPKDELVVRAAVFRRRGCFGVGTVADYLHQATATKVSVLDLGASLWVILRAFEVRMSASYPVYGKDYPALFPEQLADPRPLLGPRFQTSLAYRFVEAAH